MPKKVIYNINRAVRLFDEGWSISDIAKKIGVTKQAVSVRLRDYYCREGVLVDFIVKKVCKVCQTEEVYIEKQVPVSKLSNLRIKPFERTEKFICPLCEINNLYRCTSCGSIGHLHSDKFLRTPTSEKNRRVKCRDCNKGLTKKWKNNNLNKYNKIYSRYRRKLRKRREEKGLCVECGRNKNTPFKICDNCRKTIRNKRNHSKKQ